ncbi:hypothetical protein [Nocardioides okcheonensis]|uniref:hypothetical protein n=1 Tax=Nocardioides okcheonensis TaxID=2894081 RepID=UPI001E300AB5|nr:hypothetical protein [Nocardioides okcheonensis]UFN45518.1 hypothetical protein LN652_04730 [Nocardioides okcheonensis]
MTPLLRRLAATTVAGGLLACSGTAAHAEQWWGRDAAHDATEWSYSPEPEPCGTLTEHDRPREAATDILGLGVRHDGATIELSTRLRDASPWRGTLLSFVLDTPRASDSVHEVNVQRARPGGSLEAILYSSHIGEPDACGAAGGGGRGLPCDLAVTGPSTRGAVTVRVPRSCLGRPRWVRVGASTLRDEGRALRGDTWGRGTADAPYGPFGPRVAHGS